MKNLYSLNQYRCLNHPYGVGDETVGCFIVPFKSRNLTVIASMGGDWDHVSVSLKNRCPNWIEMCHIKNMFFEPHECVIQYHPPEMDYINNHENTLHLWRPQKKEIPMPPKIMV